MRGYIPVVPTEIDEFASAGIFRPPHAFAMTSNFQRDNVGEDHEELEFRLSYLAALDSRERLGFEVGYVLALDLEESQLGNEFGDTIELIAEVRWSQVESILLLESEEDELTWFARQEVEGELPRWLRMAVRDGAS
jgi:hypothetical protein